jgi:glycosyltransferase involved in cell wall biosynthesis
VGVLFDIQGVQSRAHGERGIARYLTGLALALQERHTDLLSAFLLNPDLAVPGTIEPLAATGRLSYPEHFDVDEARAYHVGSPIELDIGIDRIWPAAARDLPMIVTLYDLIPELFADLYLVDPGARRRYRTRLGLLQRAERVLAISEATARDAIRRLGLSPDRVRFVGAGVSEAFRPPVRREDAVAELARRQPRVRPGFVLYTGGIDHRKNIDRLLVAYASLARKLREAHQLVVVCRVLPDEQRALDARLEELGVSDDVLFPGFVADSDLVLLYQATELFVFPSLYEGFGLPVAEAMACGAPVVAARTSSLVELVEDDDALFDPSSPRAIAAALRRVLTDGDLRARLSAHGLDPRWRWPAVADRTADVYQELIGARRRRTGPRPARIAFISPLPPQRSGVADYSYRLLPELAKRIDVDAFSDQRPGVAQAPPGVSVHSLRAFATVEAIRGGYDDVVLCLGNSEHHAEGLALLARRPATVLAHEVRLTGLYAWSAAERPDLHPRSFHDVLHEMYPERLPRDLGAHGWLDVADYEQHGVLMARDAIKQSARYLVHSDYAASLAHLEADPADAAKIDVVPFGFPDPAGAAGDARVDGLVATFGLVAPVKQTTKVVEAFALVAKGRADARLAVVGPSVSIEETRRLLETIERLGISDRVEVTGDVAPNELRHWLARATVAVQLRSASNGESSASIADCLAAGIPTVATAIGSTRELPADAFVAVERDCSPEALAAEIGSLLDEPKRRQRLAAAGIAHAEANSFGRAAERILEKVTLSAEKASRRLPAATVTGSGAR